MPVWCPLQEDKASQSALAELRFFCLHSSTPAAVGSISKRNIHCAISKTYTPLPDTGGQTIFTHQLVKEYSPCVLLVDRWPIVLLTDFGQAADDELQLVFLRLQDTAKPLVQSRTHPVQTSPSCAADLRGDRSRRRTCRGAPAAGSPAPASPCNRYD